MKGVVPSEMLLHIGKRLKEEFGGLQLVDQFDFMAATSTGTLIVGMLLLREQHFSYQCNTFFLM